MAKPAKRKAPRSAAKLSTLDDLLKEDGKLEEFQAVAINVFSPTRLVGSLDDTYATTSPVHN